MEILKIFITIILITLSASSFSAIHGNENPNSRETPVQMHYKSDSHQGNIHNGSSRMNADKGRPTARDSNPRHRYQNTFFSPFIDEPVVQVIVGNTEAPISLVSNQGADNVGIYKWGDQCIIGMTGVDDHNNPHGLALWFRNTPNLIYIFPVTNNINQALGLLDDYNNANSELEQSQSLLGVGDILYQLYGESRYKNNYPLLIRQFDHDFSTELMNVSYFLVQLNDLNQSGNTVTIKYGLDGFAESVSSCSS